MDICDNKNIKTIKIEQNNKKQQTIKQINYEKEKKMRIEAKTWGLNDEELSHKNQLDALMDENFIQNNKYNTNKDKYSSKLTTHIKNKILNYKQQDILKKKLHETNFVKFEETIELLRTCNMKCCYCSSEVYILYEHVREIKQWTLDRINNDIGHNSGNLVIACLECNLKRRRTNKDAFMFTKNMVIIKEGIIKEDS
jgi:hypothetical protein